MQHAHPTTPPAQHAAGCACVLAVCAWLRMGLLRVGPLSWLGQGHLVAVLHPRIALPGTHATSSHHSCCVVRMSQLRQAAALSPAPCSFPKTLRLHGLANPPACTRRCRLLLSLAGFAVWLNSTQSAEDQEELHARGRTLQGKRPGHRPALPLCACAA